MRAALLLLVWVGVFTSSARPAEFYVAPSGKPSASGAQADPWELSAALAGNTKIAPGDTLWIAAGTYKHPNRKLGSPGYEVKLAGAEGKPIRVRGELGKRVTIDGGLSVQQPSSWLWIENLEILVSENFSMSRTVAEPGSFPKDYGRPWGGLNVLSGTGCKYINLVIHDNAQGVSFWSPATDSELYGAIIYDNGWKAPDRGHGHAIYTQNQNGVKTIADCILTGGFSYTMHAYGSSRAYVDHYLIEGNISYDGGAFLIGGGRPSHEIRLVGNYFCNVPVQLGYDAPYNEDCEVRGNVLFNSGMSINKFRKVVREENLEVRRGEPARQDNLIVVRPNRYQPGRANIVIFNWQRKPQAAVPVGETLKPGDRYQLRNPRDFFGKPLAEGVYDGKPLTVSTPGDFLALVLVRMETTARRAT